MGRRKVEIKPIQDKNTRQVTFSKRRKGLVKKAKELSILCDVDVAAVIFSNRGRLYDFSSNNSLTEIVQRYHSHTEAEQEISPEVSETEKSKYASFMTTGELFQTVERQLDVSEDDDGGISLTDLVHLENQLQIALNEARSRKTHLMIESVKCLHEKEICLREENKLLQDTITAAKNNREVNELAVNFTNLESSHMMCEEQRRTLKFL